MKKLEQIKSFSIPFLITLAFQFLPLFGISNGISSEDWSITLGRAIGNSMWIGLSEIVIGATALIIIIVSLVHKKWLRVIGILSAILLFWLWYVLFFPIM